MKVVLAFSVVVLLAIILVQAKPRGGPVGKIWKKCGNKTDHLMIGSVVIKPDPPKKGASITVTANGTLDEDVTGGSITLTAKIDDVQVLQQTFMICDLAPQAGLMCPLKKGNLSLSTTQDIPDNAPTGKYTGNAIVQDQNGDEITCIMFDFKF